MTCNLMIPHEKSINAFSIFKEGHIPTRKPYQVELLNTVLTVVLQAQSSDMSVNVATM